MFSTIKFAFRSLLRARAFTAIAVLIIALCVGANLTIFAVIDSVLLRPLPFPESQRLVTIFNSYPQAGVPRDGASFTNYYERRGQIRAFSSIAEIRPDSAIVGQPGSTERVDTARVTPEFFDTVGLRPLIGRAFHEEETTYQTDGVVVLTDAYWRQHFNADPAILSRTLRVDGYDRKIVGVLPPGFQFLSSRARFYVPLSSDPFYRGPAARHNGNGITMVARLAPGATLAEAQAQLNAHDASVAASYPQANVIAEAGFHSVVASLQGDHVSEIRPVLLLLQAGVLLLLAIGAVNLINLLLIRASSRTREFAIRQSLGAGRSDVIGEVMTETMLLAVTGGIAGLIVAAFGIDGLRLLGADRMPLGSTIAFDGRVAAVGLLGSLAFGMFIALPIAWFNLRTHLANALQSSSRNTTISRSAQRLRHTFIVVQIGLAFVLLSGAGLLALSLKRVMAVSPGFHPEHVLSGALSLPWKGYNDPQVRVAFTERLMTEMAAQPGVLSIGFTSRLPLGGESGKSSVTIQGYHLPLGESRRANYSYAVTGNYFAAMGIPLKQGRYLETADSRRTERTCVIDEDFARRYWPKGDALGHRLFQGSHEGPDAEAYTVVGVVQPVKQADLTETDALGAVYFPTGHRSELQQYIVVRARQSPETLGPVLQSIIRRLDPELALNEVRSMDQLIADGLVGRRSPALLAAIFGGVALLLAAVGAYGVLSYAVAQREREIGVRMALGAQASQIGRQFLAIGLRLLAVGSALGVVGSWLTGRAMQTILYSVPALHLGTLALTAVILTAVSLLASYLPARRASRVDPIIALRAE